jgi:3-methyladenine DNA glycosylase AlkD
MNYDIGNLENELKKLSNGEKAKIYQRFFKTGKGEYGQGDVFLGLDVPTQRSLAKKYKGLALADLQKLLSSKFHESRSVALMILVLKFSKATAEEQEKLVDFYLKNTSNINNWDLVDLSAYHILGRWLLDKDRQVLCKLARSSCLWERRIAIISTFAFIRENQFEDTLKIAEILLSDSHDLIHKAVGWMLREVGKRDLETLEAFLKENKLKMPRVMLRYAIEKMPQDQRQWYLKK